jgi:hypothetical protein
VRIQDLLIEKRKKMVIRFGHAKTMYRKIIQRKTHELISKVKRPIERAKTRWFSKALKDI